MQVIRTLLTLAIVLVLAGAVSAADGKKGKKPGGKTGNHPVHGKVIDVKKDRDKDAGTITVQVHHKKKGGASAVVERTFKVTPGTKFEIVQGKKGSAEQKSATFANVHKGEHVRIAHIGVEAKDVKIVVKGKGKKAKT